MQTQHIETNQMHTNQEKKIIAISDHECEHFESYHNIQIICVAKWQTILLLNYNRYFTKR